MIASALNDCERARVTHSEALGGDTAHEHFAASGAIQAHVADDDVLLGLEGAPLGGEDRDLATAQALAAVVVGVALKLEGDTLGHEGTEGLSGVAGDRDADSTILGGVLAEGSGVLANDLPCTQRQMSVLVYCRCIERTKASSNPWSIGHKLLAIFVQTKDVELSATGSVSHLGHLVGQDGAHAAVEIVDVDLDSSGGVVLAENTKGLSEAVDGSSRAALEALAVHL